MHKHQNLFLYQLSNFIVYYFSHIYQKLYLYTYINICIIYIVTSYNTYVFEWCLHFLLKLPAFNSILIFVDEIMVKYNKIIMMKLISFKYKILITI